MLSATAMLFHNPLLPSEDGFTRPSSNPDTLRALWAESSLARTQSSVRSTQLRKRMKMRVLSLFAQNTEITPEGFSEEAKAELYFHLKKITSPSVLFNKCPIRDILDLYKNYGLIKSQAVEIRPFLRP